MRRTPGALALAAAVLLSGCAGTAPAAEKKDGGTSTATRSSSAPTAQPREISVDFAGGKVSGDTGRVAVDAGAPVTITITSDVADEAHLHGYDLETELTPGEPAELRFDATVPGVFELELHHAEKVLLLTLQVG
jgi:hypothetical protein